MSWRRGNTNYTVRFKSTYDVAEGIQDADKEEFGHLSLSSPFEIVLAWLEHSDGDANKILRYEEESAFSGVGAAEVPRIGELK